MRQLRSPSLTSRLAGLLAWVMLVQGLLPVASHTTLARDANGDVVQVCTLEGLQTRFVDEGGKLSPDAPSGDDRTPAIDFSQLMAEALSAGVAAVVEPPRFGAVHGGCDYCLVRSAAVPGLRPIRAPPVS